MIYKFPVLFQFLLVIVYSFSPLRGMEEEQVQQQNPLTPLNLDFETLYFSAFIEGKEWLPHIYRSKDVQGLMIPFLKDYLKKDFYFSQNNPLWEQFSEQEKEKQLKKIVDFYPLSLNTRFRNQ